MFLVDLVLSIPFTLQFILAGFGLPGSWRSKAIYFKMKIYIETLAHSNPKSVTAISNIVCARDNIVLALITCTVCVYYIGRNGAWWKYKTNIQ